MLVIREDLMDIRVKNQEAVNNDSKSGHLYNINFYSSEAAKEKGQISLQLTISNYETVYAQVVKFESTDGASGNITYEDILNNDGNKEVGRTVNTEYGMAVQLNDSSLIEMIKKQEIYEIAEDMDYAYSTGYITDTYVDIPSIPEVFSSGDADDTYFAPITDNYKIVMVDIPNAEFPVPGWRDHLGTWEYGACGGNYTEKLIIIYLLSFDEFGCIEGKMKYVYESEEAQISDALTGGLVFTPSEVLGINEPNDELIPIEYYVDSDQYTFDYWSEPFTTMQIEYLGHYDLARYYQYTNLNSLDIPYNDILLQFYNRYVGSEFEYNNLHFENEGYNETDIDNCHITTYSSK